jgi:hypothetical protein
MYNDEIDAHHGGMAQATADRFALLCIYVNPAATSAAAAATSAAAATAAAAAESQVATCAAVGVLQLLLRLPSPPASPPTSSTIFSLDDGEECAALLPVTISSRQLHCIRCLALNVVGHVILCCLRSPDRSLSPSSTF